MRKTNKWLKLARVYFCLVIAVIFFAACTSKPTPYTGEAMKDGGEVGTVSFQLEKSKEGKRLLDVAFTVEGVNLDIGDTMPLDDDDTFGQEVTVNSNGPKGNVSKNIQFVGGLNDGSASGQLYFEIIGGDEEGLYGPYDWEAAIAE